MAGKFLEDIKDIINGLKNLGQILNEVRATRELLQKHVDLIQGYTEALIDIKRQLDSIIAKIPFR